MKIIQAKENDFSKIIPLCLLMWEEGKSWLPSGYGNSCSKEKLEEYVKEMLEESVLFILKENNDIMGFVRLDLCKNIAKISELFVDRQYRKRGYGKILVDWCENRAQKCNCKFVELDVAGYNSAVKFYETLQYKPINIRMKKLLTK